VPVPAACTGSETGRECIDGVFAVVVERGGGLVSGGGGMPI
jgi:hypothetical protein